jgi:hypothetical protein
LKAITTTNPPNPRFVKEGEGELQILIIHKMERKGAYGKRGQKTKEEDEKAQT